MTIKHSRSPKKFLTRVYNKKEEQQTYPYVYVKQRTGGVAWFPQEKQKELRKALIAKEHLLIGS
jgi:hypothetical protein